MKNVSLLLFMTLVISVAPVMAQEEAAPEEFEMKVLEYYTGQSVDDLIRMQQTHQPESLVMAFETALAQKADREGLAFLSEPEQLVLVIETLEREVKNGGYEQFFANTSQEYTDMMVSALEQISCPKTAEITQQAIDARARGEDLTPFDDLYFHDGESITERLFEYIKRNKEQITF